MGKRKVALKLTGLLLTVLTTWSAPAMSQQSAPRGGTWVAGGIGGGWTHVRCDICANDHKFGLSGYARIGATLTQQVALGIEAAGWRKPEEAVTSRLGTVSAAIYWYPTAARNAYYLKAGMGVIAYELDDNPAEGEEDEDPITARSLAGHIGLGYEIRLTDKLSFNPFVNVVGSLYADLTTAGTQISDAGITLIQIGAGVMWH